MDKIEKLKSMIKECNNIVAFTGAGISTDSGLKDFRSKDGLYKKQSKYPAEYMLSSNCFYNNQKEFYEYYKENFNCLDIKPNITHNLLKKLEDIGKLKAIITQNIDGLHTKAGSTNVYEIHGTIMVNHCISCGKEYNAEYVFNHEGVPKCTYGGVIKPDVVLYGEALPEDTVMSAIYEIENADLLIIAGTSLSVYPAASFINYFRGFNIVLINRDNTDYNSRCNLVINDDLGNIFNKLYDKIKTWN